MDIKGCRRVLVAILRNELCGDGGMKTAAAIHKAAAYCLRRGGDKRGGKMSSCGEETDATNADARLQTRDFLPSHSTRNIAVASTSYLVKKCTLSCINNLDKHSLKTSTGLYLAARKYASNESLEVWW